MARDPNARLDVPTFNKHDIERIAKESVAPIVADLVDKAIDDGRINIDDNVQRIIQADKDILSKITVTYDETNNRTKFTLPEGIYPLNFVIWTGFPQYQCFLKRGEMGTMYIVGSNGQAILNGRLNRSSTFFDIILDGNLSTATICFLTYINYNFGKSYGSDIESYYLYHPVTSAGTKLYRHHLTIKDGQLAQDLGEFDIISTDSQSYSPGFEMGICEYIIASPDLGNDFWSGIPTYITAYENQPLEIHLCDGTSYISSDDIGQIIDNVYEM